jgi:hypothetical protein
MFVDGVLRLDVEGSKENSGIKTIVSRGRGELNIARCCLSPTS